MVCLANGTTHGKSGHFKRAVSYYEALSDYGLTEFRVITVLLMNGRINQSSALASCESFHTRHDDDGISE